MKKHFFYIVHNHIKQNLCLVSQYPNLKIKSYIVGFFLAEWIILTREKISSYFMHGKQSVFTAPSTSDSKNISIRF